VSALHDQAEDELDALFADHRFEGRVEIAGKEVSVDGWRGMVGRCPAAAAIGRSPSSRSRSRGCCIRFGTAI
jgi:hypothetical protein